MARLAIALIAVAWLATAARPAWAEEQDKSGSVAEESDESAADATPPMSLPPPPPAPAPEATPPADAGKGDACIDENVKADLFAKRKQRSNRERLFQQTNRHELTAWGGYYVSDLFDGTYTVGGSYSYHMTEDLAVEASGGYTRLTSSGGPELERTFAVLQGKPRRQLTFDADLVWAPAHGKMRLGGQINHFDLYLVAGSGVVDSVLSENVAGNAGFGLKFFGRRAFAVRLDVRDHVYRQQLLSQVMWVNDLTATVGLSLFLPVTE
jgi:outer membrane beta-barrel protein